MANVKNLFAISQSVAGEVPKKISFAGGTVKNVYFNNILVWKNSDEFYFVDDISKINTDELSSDTIIFVGFSKEDFNGTFTLTEKIEDENPSEIGEMIVQNIDEVE